MGNNTHSQTISTTHNNSSASFRLMVLITLQTKEISSSLSRFKEDINLKSRIC